MSTEKYQIDKHDYVKLLKRKTYYNRKIRELSSNLDEMSLLNVKKYQLILDEIESLLDAERNKSGITKRVG
jgi:hypothetical protein